MSEWTFNGQSFEKRYAPSERRPWKRALASGMYVGGVTGFTFAVGDLAMAAVAGLTLLPNDVSPVLALVSFVAAAGGRAARSEIDAGEKMQHWRFEERPNGKMVLEEEESAALCQLLKELFRGHNEDRRRILAAGAAERIIGAVSKCRETPLLSDDNRREELRRLLTEALEPIKMEVDVANEVYGELRGRD